MIPQLVMFDLDGTLAESRMPMDDDMAQLLQELLERTEVAVITGGSFERIKTQFLDVLNKRPVNLGNLFLGVLSGSTLYTYTKDWAPVYSETMIPEQRAKVIDAFQKAFKDIGFVPPQNPKGKLIDDRGGQITFSGLGAEAPIEEKKKWDPDRKKRIELKAALQKYIPEFEISIGGTTSIDISRGGIDKAYGVTKLSEYLSIPREEILFMGDALQESGNDYSVTTTGIRTQLVEGPNETKKYIRELLAQAR